MSKWNLMLLSLALTFGVTACGVATDSRSQAPAEKVAEEAPAEKVAEEAPAAEVAKEAPDPAAESVAATDRTVAAITQDLGTFERVEVDLHGLSTEGGKAVLYSGEGEDLLLRADLTLYGEMGQVGHSFSFDSEHRLIFDERHTSEYDQPYGNVVRERREKIYLAEGRIVRWVVDGGADSDADDAERRRTEAELNAISSDILSAPRGG